MITELGHFCLILAFVVAVFQTVVPQIGAWRRWPGWMSAADTAAILQAGLIILSFLALVHAFVVSDFSLRLVAENSHSDKPLLYKISGVWGNHEGSMLLWVLILSIFGAAGAIFGGNLPPTFKARMLSVQGFVGAAFLAFTLFTSDPFIRLAMPPFDGSGMNPLLQDPGLAFHPPFLYLGYVGLSMCFSFAVAALIEGRVDAAWGRWVRPWTLAAWMFLTVGIALGSLWAYYELGWGGFWYWDPVENASFMPWLISAALLHSAIVVEKRESLKAWTVLLAIIAFGFSMIGAFITRSGVITSVHAFASDPQRGVFLLGITGAFMLASLTLFAARSDALTSRGVFSLVSRESALVVNNVLLAVAAFVVFIGTMWPLIAQMLFHRTLSVGAPFFDMAFSPFMIVLGLLLPLGSIMPWKRAKFGRTARRLIPAAVLAIAVLALAWAMSSGKSVLGPFGLMLGTWLVAGSLTDLWMRKGSGSVKRLFRLPRADWGRVLAHAGFGICIIGITVMLSWQQQSITVLKKGESTDLAGYNFVLDDVHSARGPNFRAEIADVTVTHGGKLVAVVHPEKRFFPVAGQTTTEAAINNGFLRDIYVVVGDPQDGGGWAFRSYYKPLANWIWGGALLMALGGAISLSDRRYRIAAGAARDRRKAVPADKGVPAE